ncbi:MAG: ChbG/HpnK family deacetylase [Proteobacteria bacterium]|nr:ChbG/HpnK family deacetylase [Pseudomonadota bacterium]
MEARRPPTEARIRQTVATRRLVINADDFGLSTEINEAVIRAHREGILTTASLMVNGPAFAEAVALAKENPTLGVGLHLTLVCGKATCSQLEIPDLVTAKGDFSNSPVGAGIRYYFNRSLQLQLAREIGAQFAKFKSTGLTLDHVNGHLNMHLHPTVLRILLLRHLEWGIRHFRLTDDPFGLSGQLAQGHFLYRASHAFIFRQLARQARKRLVQAGVQFTDHVFGLLQNGRVDEAYVLKLLPLLPRGDSELYSHPSVRESRHEFDALISPRVKARIEELRIETLRYQDL